MPVIQQVMSRKRLITSRAIMPAASMITVRIMGRNSRWRNDDKGGAEF
jgi:hypothetical protein